MKKLKLILIVLFLPLFVLAQTKDSHEEFSSMRQELLDEYNDFRKEINEEYAGFLSQTWEEFKLFRANPVPAEPKPAIQPDYTTGGGVYKGEEITVEDSILFRLAEGVQPESRQSIQTADLFEGTPLSVEYYGLNMKLRYRIKPFYLPSTDEKDVSGAWKEYSGTRFANLLIDMLGYKEKVGMNDWAYFLFTKQVAFQLAALKDENSRLVFQHFLLVQSGYDVRLAKSDALFVLLVPFRQMVYDAPYLQIEGKPYYVICNQKLNSYSSLYTYRLPIDFKKGKISSLALSQPPALPVQGKTFTLEAAGICVKGTVNLNLIRFYRDYLKSDLSVYACAKPGTELTAQLTGAFAELRNRKDTLSALNRLLEWTQIAFQYQTDQKQFGREKPFFIDENFYYPFNDCEDRAVLFAYLVRKLWGMETILLDYPGHVATAVCLPFGMKGDYVMFRKKKYIICDPTFIHAGVGRCMPTYKSKKAAVIIPD